jgi:hypothetical protein
MITLLGLAFFLLYSKLSDGSGFWSNLRDSDKNTYKLAIEYQRCLRKTNKAQLDLHFLHRCKDNGLSPKFVRWKNLKSKDAKERSRYMSRFLADAITEKRTRLKHLRSELTTKDHVLKSSTTWMRYILTKHTIDRLISRETTTIKSRHEKKIKSLQQEKAQIDDIQENPNDIIINLSGIKLDDHESEVLELGLKQGLAKRPSEALMVVTLEDIWHQIKRLNVIKRDSFLYRKIKTTLRAFTYGYLDIEDNQFDID